jgi:hypothetical protein
MNQIPWWRLGVLALWEPLRRWRLLLLCVVAPLVTGTALWFLFNAVERLDSELTFFTPLAYLRAYALIVIPQLVFDWCWINALWHGDRGQAIRFVVTPRFWRFCALLLPVYVAARLMFWPLAYLDNMFDWIEAAFDRTQASTLYDAFSPFLVIGIIVILFAVILYIAARFYPWNAAMIDQGRWIGPRSIWSLTRRHALGIAAVIAIAHLVCEGLQVLLGFTLVRLDLVDRLGYWRLVLSTPLEAYGYAAYATAALVIYRRLMEEQAPSAEATAAQF